MVATPIGNLEDLTVRAARVLAEVDLVLCEDTRRTGKLLAHIGTSTPMLSLHEHNEEERSRGILERLGAGVRIALVSDAGTPTLSDPGYRLVRAAREAGIGVIAVPGPSAALTALSVAGLPTDRYLFLGFPPSRAAARRTFFRDVATESATLVLYESPHRLVASLEDLAEGLGPERRAFMGRELTKLHEEHVFATLGELRDAVRARGKVKGEITLVVEGAEIPRAAEPPATELAEEVARLVEGGMDPKAAVKEVARRHRLGKSVVYDAYHR